MRLGGIGVLGRRARFMVVSDLFNLVEILLDGHRSLPGSNSAVAA